MNNLSVKRHEIKYLISRNDYITLSKRLNHVLAIDKHCIFDKGYLIRSLYFDSFDDECLYDKLSGVMHRKKYRMRIYDFKTKNVNFEIKTKSNNQISKESAIISKESANRIIGGNHDELLTYDNPILNKAYLRFNAKHYMPKVIVDYQREAYTFSFFKLRITFDKFIKSNTTHFDLFSQGIHLLPVILENKYLMEVKYDQILPDYIRNSLQLKSFERISFSKYVLARRFSKVEQWEDS